jgi:indolepyruvate ferredoxin oxidoreductase
VTDSRRNTTSRLPPDVQIYHRDDYDRVQREIREVPGCSVIV